MVSGLIFQFPSKISRQLRGFTEKCLCRDSNFDADSIFMQENFLKPKALIISFFPVLTEEQNTVASFPNRLCFFSAAMLVENQNNFRHIALERRL
jgi:hypothetical protein